MSSVSIYAATVTTFTRVLRNLDAMLDKGKAEGDIDALLAARLAPNMFPLLKQVQVVTDFAKNTTARLAGLEISAFPDTETNLAELKARIERTIAFVESAPQTSFAGAETRSVTFAAGPDVKLTMTGEDYLLTFALPNFYFHATTAYAILRHNGVNVGKMDFLNGLPV